MLGNFFRSAGALIVSTSILAGCGGGNAPTASNPQSATPDPVATPGPAPSSSSGASPTATAVDAPLAVAGWDRVVASGELVTLDGRASRDPNNLSLDYAWTQVGGPPVMLAKAAMPEVSFIAPTQTIPTSLVFQLRVTNPLGAQSLAQVTITISPPADDNFYVRLCLDILSLHDLCAGGVRDDFQRFNGVPVLALPAPRGAIVKRREAARTPSTKIVDGNPSDWIGTPTRLGGTMRLDAGELIYTDFVFDAYGADDGGDAQRLEVLDPLAEWEQRTFRADQLFQAAGDQFGAPAPIGALDRYGDTTALTDGDLHELRWAANATHAYLLARFPTTAPQLRVLLDTAPGSVNGSRFEQALRISSTGVGLENPADGSIAPISGASAAASGGVLEAAIPVGALANVSAIAVIAGQPLGSALIPANVAYRFNEPVAGVYNDKAQALALYRGNVDAFAIPLDLAALRGGATESFALGAGYYERQFLSGANISAAGPEDGRLQPYGLYIPTAYDPARPSPLTFWLHYRGGKTHSGAAWTPRLIQQLGEKRNNIVVTPRGRGTSTWYTTRAHQDFFEVFNDVAGTAIVGADRYESQSFVAPLVNVDPARVYLSGYSMGGYGTYLFGLLYPDLFAAGFSTSGAVTQGLWTGYGPDDARCEDAPRNVPEVGEANLCFGEANDSDANAQLNYRILENARHFPIVINHGTNDELVPITGVQRMGTRLAELGYRYNLEMYLGYEHYTQAIIDQWDDGANYLNRFARPANPRRVTYKVDPALVRALNTVQSRGMSFAFKPDRAYWVSDVAVRNPDPADPKQTGMIDAESLRIPANKILPVPMAADTGPGTVATPVASPTGQSTPYVRHGQDWLERAPERTANAFNARLTNLATATLDASRMQLDLGRRVDATLISDGDTTLTLANLAQPVQVFLNGFAHPLQGSAASFIVPAGLNHLVMVPAGAAAPTDVPGSTPDLATVCRTLGAAAEPVCEKIDVATTLAFNSCGVLTSAAPICAMANGNLHGLIDQCRKPQNHLERVCKGAEQILYGVASACRLQPGVPAEFCALLSGDLIAPGEVLNFEKSWTARAQDLQRRLGDPVAFHDADFPATHNSFNWTTANNPPTLSGSDSNQKYSIPDQLRMGIRAIEVDVHWMPHVSGTLATQFRIPMICHGNANHAGCTYERPLGDGLQELRSQWLDSHPDQVIILYLEANIDEQIDDASVSFDATAAVVEAVLGAGSAKDLLFRPGEHGAQCNDDAPITDPTSWINLNRAQIHAAGKQVMIFTGTCGQGAGWPAIAHNKKSPHYVETSGYEGFTAATCRSDEGAFSAAEYANKWTRLFEDSTWLSAIVSGPSQLITARELGDMVRCGVNMPSLDQVTPTDPRLAAFVWSWRQGEPGNDPTKHCARHGVDGRFVAEDCARPLPIACVNPANPRDWTIGGPASAWGAATCPAGYAFGVPRAGSHNESLKQAKAAAGTAEVWLRYSNSGGDWATP